MHEQQLYIVGLYLIIYMMSPGKYNYFNDELKYSSLAYYTFELLYIVDIINFWYFNLQ